MPFCDLCNGWSMNLDHHRCPPTWTCVAADKGYDCAECYEQRIIATDAEAAAEKYAEAWDCEGDYDILRSSTEFLVRVTAEDGSITFWDVIGESLPHYSARENYERDEAA